jgi:glycosyltransferase involved in cell wall biosynthesis
MNRRVSRPPSPRVSVITPAYNVEAYLADAAQSVLGQTCRDLELLIVNDGSTDRTGEVADRVQQSDPERVRILTTRNAGPAAARNAALAVARGEFIALLDGDDMWDPPFLERQLAIFDARPDVDLVTGNGRFLGGRRHGTPARPSPDPRPPLTLATIIGDEQAVFVMTVFRRRVFERLGGFDEAVRGNEDFEYWLRAASAGFRFERNAEPLSWYRQRDDSLSTDAVRMLRGALGVCTRARPLLADRPERLLLERQITYYEAELNAALARQALTSGDRSNAARALAALHASRPSWRTAAAAMLARRAAPLLFALYYLKRRAQA